MSSMHKAQGQRMTKKANQSEYEAFVSLTDKLLAVPHSAIAKDVEQHKKDAANDPHKRGPKAKRKATSTR